MQIIYSHQAAVIYINHFFGPLGVLVGFGPLHHLVLVLFAVDPLMNGLLFQVIRSDINI